MDRQGNVRQENGAGECGEEPQADDEHTAFDRWDSAGCRERVDCRARSINR